MDFALVSRLQVALEGVPLPAQKSELVAYARSQDAGDDALNALRTIPEREYESLDDVGEELAPVQPSGDDEQVDVPRAESGLPPGGDAYTDQHPETGKIRDTTSSGPHDEGLSGDARRHSPSPGEA
jgi:Protein of unknown function (DUF2795)